MVKGVIDGETESEGGDCDEVICAGWGEPGGQWTGWGWRNEERNWFSYLLAYRTLFRI